MAELTPSRLLTLMSYDEMTGRFIRNVATNNRVRVGDVCGFVDIDGYRRIRVDGRLYLAHRLAWFAATDAWPVAEIDHKNGDRDDNRLQNLRPADRHENSCNKGSRSNATGFRGVGLDKRSGKYVAAVTSRRTNYHLGTFSSAEEAHAAYSNASRNLHGEFARTR